MENNVVITLFKKVGLSLEKINQLSVQTGFIKRFRQIKAAEFLVYMIIESIRGCVSCNDLAVVIEAQTGTAASRQAYHQKMSCACLLFFEAIAEIIMNTKESVSVPSKFRRFKRILIQDSTVIKLPSKLMGVFSGVKNATTQVCNARIHAPLLQKIHHECKKTLSLMKLIRYISRNLKAIPQLLDAVNGSVKCLRTIGRYCAYDKRKRLNFIEKEIKILTIFDAMETLS